MYKSLSFSGYAFARDYDEVSSTMDVARESIPSLDGGHGVVASVRQTAGRGRQGRAWSSPEGALMVTFLFSTALPVHAFGGYSLAVGVALTRAFARYGAAVQLKWPNDLVTVRDDRIQKIGGILIEVQDVGATRVLLVGIGINLTSAPDEVEAAAALESVCAENVPHREEALAYIAGALSESHATFEQAGFAKFRAPWEQASAYEKGRTELIVEIGERTLSGIYDGVNDSGALLLMVNGRREVVHSGHTVSARSLRDGAVL